MTKIIMSIQQKTAFQKVFGDSPYVKALDFFLDNEEFDYSKTTIAQETGISRITLEPILRKLVQLGVIRHTRACGRAILYQFNKGNALALQLREFDLQLCEQKIRQLVTNK